MVNPSQSLWDFRGLLGPAVRSRAALVDPSAGVRLCLPPGAVLIHGAAHRGWVMRDRV